MALPKLRCWIRACSSPLFHATLEVDNGKASETNWRDCWQRPACPYKCEQGETEANLTNSCFCGRQNIALRGHRDDSTYLKAQHGRNTGNFQELLDFRVKSGDSILEEHLKTAKSNANYRSKTIQNEIISCCGDYISQTIIKEIKESGIVVN